MYYRFNFRNSSSRIFSILDSNCSINPWTKRLNPYRFMFLLFNFKKKYSTSQSLWETVERNLTFEMCLWMWRRISVQSSRCPVNSILLVGMHRSDPHNHPFLCKSTWKLSNKISMWLAMCISWLFVWLHNVTYWIQSQIHLWHGRKNLTEINRLWSSMLVVKLNSQFMYFLIIENTKIL